jgi:Phytanoyl-CoA dioxygenase (PhyH)
MVSDVLLFTYVFCMHKGKKCHQDECSDMNLFTLTDEEKQSATLSPTRLQEAIRLFQDAGILGIANVYDTQFLDTVRVAYDAQLEDYLAARGGLDALEGKTFGKNHIGFFPRIEGAIAEHTLAAHPIAIQIMDVVLGKDFSCSFYHTNTACPGSGIQPTHRDFQHLFGDALSVPHPTTSIVVNVPLCDFTEENGSTQYWPGSHLVVDSTQNGSAALEARASNMPSIRLNLPLGSLALRDLRAWHRGMPNNADYPRTMFAIVYQREWLSSVPMQIPQDIWDEWPKRVQKIYRKNKIVEAEKYTAMTWDDLK